MDAATARSKPAPPDPDLRADLIAEAKSILSTHPKLFLSQGRLVEVAEDRDRAWPVPLTAAVVKKHLWLSGPWQHFLEENLVDQPAWLPAALLREESWPDARRLAGITDVPMLRPDGTLLTTPGYDAATGLWYAPSVALPDLPAHPTQADARAAVEELNRILDIFPVVSKAHRSSLLAALLTPLANEAIPGPSPLFLLDAPGAGIAATQAAELLGHLLRGHTLTRMEKPTRERQFRRQLARLEAPDDGLVLLEGAEEFHSAASLSTALLRWQWTNGPRRQEGRRLTWFARSSNADVTRDAAEGLLPIRFYDTDDQVRAATFDWPHPLDGWAAAHRPGFLRAALVLLRAYVCAGRPAQPHAGWPRFTGWADLIAGALLWVGLEDPLLARRALEASIGDDNAGGIRRLVTAIAEVCPPGRGLTTREILCGIGQDDDPWNEVHDALESLLPGQALNGRSVGNLLRTCRGISVEGVFLHRLGKDSLGYARWTVERSPLVASALPTLHRYAAEPDPEPDWVQDGNTKRLVDDPAAPVDRICDYALVRAPAPVPLPRAEPARAESAESARARSATRPESAESARAKSAAPSSPGSARSLIPNFDAELDRVAASLRANGTLNPLLTRPPALPQRAGAVPQGPHG